MTGPDEGFRSAAYWESRYAAGHTSGSGSRGHLAAYKADVINGLVAQRGIAEVIDFGSGDGEQIALFDIKRLTGVDVSETALGACRARFADRPDWRFIRFEDAAAFAGRYRMALSLDVVYHLIEDDVFEAYMTRLFDHASEIVVIYASDEDGPGGAEHVRHRSVTGWVERRRPEWRLSQRLAHPYGRPVDTPHHRHTTWAVFMIFEKPAPEATTAAPG